MCSIGLVASGSGTRAGEGTHKSQKGGTVPPLGRMRRHFIQKLLVLLGHRCNGLPYADEPGPFHHLFLGLIERHLCRAQARRSSEPRFAPCLVFKTSQASNRNTFWAARRARQPGAPRHRIGLSPRWWPPIPDPDVCAVRVGEHSPGSATPLTSCRRGFVPRVGTTPAKPSSM